MRKRVSLLRRPTKRQRYTSRLATLSALAWMNSLFVLTSSPMKAEGKNLPPFESVWSETRVRFHETRQLGVSKWHVV
jgi:hypothetical protein